VYGSRNPSRDGPATLPTDTVVEPARSVLARHYRRKHVQEYPPASSKFPGGPIPFPRSKMRRFSLPDLFLSSC
jgi:hypothetical protein